MPTTRKKVIKTVYKDEESEGETGDFSDSGSDANISEPPSSDEEEIIEGDRSSGDEFCNKTIKKRSKQPTKRKPKFAKEFINKINKQTEHESEDNDVTPTLFNVKDLTDADKLLPASLNLSESDSSDDEAPKPPKITPKSVPQTLHIQESSDEEETQYNEWSKMRDSSAELAKKTFMELEQHKNTIEETKASLQNYVHRSSIEAKKESNVKDLLALGEEVDTKISPTKKRKPKKTQHDSESEVEDWEEVKESKSIPQQGLQLIVALPDSVNRKSKKVDVEMMMRRKINRVKKEHQVFMHKVHVLCWLGHGNFVSRVLNDQEILTVVQGIVPKGCYPKDRLDMKYVEQITTWYKEKFVIKPDKFENKFRPKAPPLKNIMLDQIKKRAFTSKKYSVFVFVAMLRSLGLQCRVMFNFVTVPLKPPSSELCSLSTKPKVDENTENKSGTSKAKGKTTTAVKNKQKLAQMDGIYDSYSSDSEFENIMQVDGNNDGPMTKTRSLRSSRMKKTEASNENKDEDVSPPKKSKNHDESKGSTKPNAKKIALSKPPQTRNNKNSVEDSLKLPNALSLKKPTENDTNISKLIEQENLPKKIRPIRKTGSKIPAKPPNIIVTCENEEGPESQYFQNSKSNIVKKVERTTRKRAHTTVADDGTLKSDEKPKSTKGKSRTKSAPGTSIEKSKYFESSESEIKKPKLGVRQLKQREKLENSLRVSHRDLSKSKEKSKNDVTSDLIDIIKNRIKHAKEEAKKAIVKGRVKEESDNDSDYLPEEPPRIKSESDDDFKPTKISPRAQKLSPGVKPSTSKKIDRRVFSTDDELRKQDEIEKSKKIDVWCEVFVEELEQWIAIDVVKGKVHSAGDLYSHATHPVCYIVGWDNNNYLKDLTRRYVPHWNTVTRKQRAEPEWWQKAIQPWLGPRNAKDREEDDALDRMQMEAPLPKSIAEYKNHPLYALKRHLLKFEAIYPPDAATLGFVRNEAVYARECVYTCRSRDTWLKEAMVVKLGEQPYKVVKARPKWDKLSNKLITDKPLEVFGPWQVQDYEPPTAENGVVPRNAYGNVELFKDCMLPKGTVHIKLPGLNRVARKLNIDCAPAMTGFEFNGGWSHPVYDGFVVCQEFQEIITDAWLKDQEEQERKEQEKVENRVYGNWKRLIKGLLIRERLKLKYGFEEPSTSQPKRKSNGPRLVVRKK